jgi:hypothetical protein
MTETQFLTALEKTTKAYRWRLIDGKIRAKARYHVKEAKAAIEDNTFDPLTAVMRFNRQGTHSVREAVVKSQYPIHFTMAVIKGADKLQNRGYPQVLRGKMKKVLKLKD